MPNNVRSVRMHRNVYPNTRKAMDQSLALLCDAAKDSLKYYATHYPNNSEVALMKGDMNSFERELRRCIDNHVIMMWRNEWFEEKNL
jgi:hypothetical protein